MNWMVDNYGFVDINYFIDCCLTRPQEEVTKTLRANRPFPVICTFPKEVLLEDEDEEEYG